MKNLLKETLEEMNEHGKTKEMVADVQWDKCVQRIHDWEHKRHEAVYKVHGCSWKLFEIASNFEYDDGYGGQEINSSLRVVFMDGSWLERHEYDGSEWWEYKESPEPAEIAVTSVKEVMKAMKEYGWHDDEEDDGDDEN